uniref:Uncharacterized protein n=1 Tax=Candidatus Methanophaga sp. ANME-1 ERB7 TaxID=2759913 RepID=A0A7G9Z1L9_9EURY|nr:hypothetical protein CKCBCIOL_00010 [Methanosarcinales archaeon ANME-1 ERB7]
MTPQTTLSTSEEIVKRPSIEIPDVIMARVDYGWAVVEGRNQDAESCAERAKCHRALYS